jgi:hypothetical protein
MAKAGLPADVWLRTPLSLCQEDVANQEEQYDGHGQHADLRAFRHIGEPASQKEKQAGEQTSTKLNHGSEGEPIALICSRQAPKEVLKKK